MRIHWISILISISAIIIISAFVAYDSFIHGNALLFLFWMPVAAIMFAEVYIAAKPQKYENSHRNMLTKA